MSFSLTLELKRVQNAVQVQGDAIVYPANHTACFSVTDCLLPAQQFYGPGTVLCDVLQLFPLSAPGGCCGLEDQTKLLGLQA